MPSTVNASELSLPVPQIRLPTGKKVVDIPDSSQSLRPESSLILLSSHCSGSLNAWSVELTVQANYCTSIAGLIHCGQTGGHSNEIKAAYRHPWLPVIMTIASAPSLSEGAAESGNLNEMIIWNADLAGPLDQASQVQELTRVSSTELNSFSAAAWVPPISLSSSMGALSRCPSSGLFVTNIGNELCLFQTSLFPVVSANNSHALYYSTQPIYSASDKMVTVTSHSGSYGMNFVSQVEPDLSQYDDIVSLHAFRMSSTVIDHGDAQDASCLADMSNEVLVVLIENRKVECKRYHLDIPQHTYTSYLHVWRVILRVKGFSTPTEQNWYQPSTQNTQIYRAEVKKVFSDAFPLANEHSFVSLSQPSCDIASSLQLQLPFLSSPYIFKHCEL